MINGRRLAGSAAPVLLLFLLLTGCAGEGSTPPPESPRIAAPVGDTLPAGSRLPRFGVGQGRLLLSYVISDTVAGDRLYVREYRDGSWGPDSLVIGGDDWFVNWADFPSVRPLGEGLFYHFLAYSGAGTYDYDINFSANGARPQVLHSDGVSSEHGFLSAAPLADGSLRVSWLDGRNTGGSAVDHAHHGGSGAMTLRTARVSPDGGVHERTELDHRVCDCCNTTTVATADLTMVAYRDRSTEEIRDIAYAILPAGADAWQTPGVVHPDGWEITGCPVNGPALAANAAGAVALAWYTAAGGVPRIQFARYAADSASFAAPIIIDDRDPLGRVDLKLAADGTAYLLGMASTSSADTAAVTLYTITPAGTVGQRELARLAASRRVGFPRLALHGGTLWVAYTEVSDRGSSVRVLSAS
ncbi:hypothetical protein [Lewinella sp. IMCC34183]|uniref:hypothetical protein n=1 Tax=Lewinella sp. IMCC34183 TaxID=2248762 RepID=UPI000E26FFB2|nr:hypothetical protein [Lewinella sp. IMCC34183]